MICISKNQLFGHLIKKYSVGGLRSLSASALAEDSLSFICDSCVACSSCGANFEDVLEATAGCLPGLHLLNQRQTLFGVL